ncbi:helix-loop-helix DNA-binding domain-containing protein [Hirsutella rhossiliensis]|uniref:Helix-loop-helix DNA-binding domain-containing protein n=1 Tax=Hirsutella rhossiliensis TaxID=111463 RepID=A0A9P8MLR1_9HYPO|nr:helix-loop-helix DNA-binding domain-containing protein [Hirsutella rhossiliensis]KAH0957460.1 helix-loop-helix DNA-binding domain-containing protein [Hirsutella rhossiliensis]
MDMHAQQQRSAPAKAAGLTNILNQDDQPPSRKAPLPQLRDSGFYSTAEAPSKHTSAASFIVNGLSPTASGYQSSSADKTPSPVAANMVPQALVSPSASNMSVASMVSPTSPGALDQRRFDRPTSLESQGHGGASLGDNLMAGVSAARRESVDSRINQGFSDMRLGGSPYTSNNQSTTSIQNTLHSQRNPRPGLEALSVHRISNGYQPSADRNPEPKTVKTAPAITGPATGHIARAAEPTKGQAWAFPEEEIQRVGPPGLYDDSRRSSITESIASSQFTTESRLPPGQRRLEDGSEHGRLSHITTDFPPVHHHSMQHKQLSDLQAEENNGATGSQPYSRTPELRVSHKLAERKRRTEMKELFDQLRDLMPQERGSKASKWEILTKAIAEHQRQSEHLRLLQSHYNTALAENEMLRRELHSLRGDGAHSSSHPPQGPQQGSQPGPYTSDPYAGASRTELPPLRSISNSIPNGPDSMTGVQYEAPRVNGYRHERY